MKKLCLLLSLCISTLACAQDKLPLLGDTEHQRESILLML